MNCRPQRQREHNSLDEGHGRHQKSERFRPHYSQEEHTSNYKMNVLGHTTGDVHKSPMTEKLVTGVTQRIILTKSNVVSLLCTEPQEGDNGDEPDHVNIIFCCWQPTRKADQKPTKSD